MTEQVSQGMPYRTSVDKKFRTHERELQISFALFLPLRTKRKVTEHRRPLPWQLKFKKLLELFNGWLICGYMKI